MEVSGQLHEAAALPTSGKSPGTHWIRGWMGPRASLNSVVKRKIPSLCWESNPRTAIPIELSWLFHKVIMQTLNIYKIRK
jgi:hypothetical protein